MADPLVSIIIPLYNAEKYVAETISSALNQSWPNKEIIVVDDGSTDGSLSIAKGFESGNLKVLSQENKGAGAARNKGLREAKGDYIQFLDADDLLSSNKIEEQLNHLSKFPGYIGLCATVHFQDGTIPTQQDVKHEWYATGSNDPVDFLIKLYGGALIGPTFGGMIQPNAWLTSKDLILKAGPWNEMKNPDDDGEFFCRVVLASSGITYSYKSINYYRKFNSVNTLSGRKDYEALANTLKSTDLKASHLLSKTTSPDAKLALSRLYFENAFSFYPQYKSLAYEAEKKAKALMPSFHYRPYNGGIKLVLSKLLGWKAVRFLQYLKMKVVCK